MSNRWKLSIYDQKTKKIFKANGINSYYGGWDVFNIRIRPHVTMIHIFIDNVNNKGGKPSKNLFYFFDSEGELIHTESIIYEFDSHELKIFEVNVPENTAWLNGSIDIENKTNVFWIAGNYPFKADEEIAKIKKIHENETNKAIKLTDKIYKIEGIINELIQIRATKKSESLSLESFGITLFNNYYESAIQKLNILIKSLYLVIEKYSVERRAITFSIKKIRMLFYDKNDLEKMQTLIESNIEEYKNPDFVPQDSDWESTAFYSIKYYPKVDQHQILDPYNSMYTFLNLEKTDTRISTPFDYNRMKIINASFMH